MPTSEIDRIMNSISEMRRENAREHEALHEKLNAMAVDGTAVSRNNHETLEKHDKIIDRHERYINKQVGQVAGITVGTTILIWVGKILLTKVL